MIKQIKLVNIPVQNQARALAFYTEKLGFTIITDQPFDDQQRWIELRIPKAQTRVTLFTPAGHADRVGAFTGISFETDDLAATYEELRAKGVSFAAPPEVQPWGSFAKFTDSEGNEFVLSESRG